MKVSRSSDEYAAKVLLVDDQMMVGEAVRRMLSGEPNIDFHYCSDPNEAIAVAREVQPTVILQDLVMPNVDGLDLVRKYRLDPVTSSIPIIVLSTKEEAAIKREAFSAGANDYLVKLPDPMELVARIRYHSRAHLNQVQRDEAYRALRESQQQLMQANLELQSLAMADGLTGLSNRRHCDEYIAAEWDVALRRQHPLSVLMIDVDDFKKYNDCYGHLAGDDVLKHVASAIRGNCPGPIDLAARFGGEEFIMVLHAPSRADLATVGAQVCRDVECLGRPEGALGVERRVTVSIGGALMTPRQDNSPADLIKAADNALYEAKAQGKNRAVICED
jgi:two-component system chemotaxis family response regulator WspR